MYGVPVGVNFNNQQTHKTYFGAIISFLVFIASSLSFYQTGQDLFYKNNPQIITSEQYVRNPQRMNFDKKQQTVMMGFSTTQSKYIYDPSIIQVNATLSTVKNVYNETSQSYYKQNQKIPLRIRACKIQDIQVEKVKSFFNLLPLNQMFCFDDNQEVFIEGDYSGDIYTRVDVVFNQCVNSTLNNSVVCQPQKQIDIALSNISFLVYMIDKIVDPSNFQNPFDYQGFNIQTQASNQNPIQYTSYFENYYIESDVGLIQKDVQKERDFIFTGTDTTIMYNNPNLVMKFTMRPYKNKQIIMQRKYMKFTDLFAQLGGLLKFLSMIGFVISHPFAKLHLNKEIINSVFDLDFLQRNKTDDIKDNDCDDKNSNQKNLISLNQQTMLNLQNGKNQDQILKFEDMDKISSIQDKKPQLNAQTSKNQYGFSLINERSNIRCEESPNFNLRASRFTQQSIQSSPYRKNSIANKIFSQLKADRIIQKQRSKSFIQLESQNQSICQQAAAEQAQFLEQILKNIQKLLNPIRNIIKLSPFQYISYFFFRYSSKQKVNKALIEEGIRKVQSRLDIQHILHKLQEIEKLKQIVLNEDQIKLFEILPRPILSSSQTPKQNQQQNQFYNTEKKSYEEKVDDAYNSLINILNKTKKSQRDIQLIQLLDSNIYKIIQQSELGQEKNSILKEDFSKFYQNYEQLENKSQMNINMFPICKELNLQKFESQKEDLEQNSYKTEHSDEAGIQTDIYFNFPHQYKKKSLNNS
ncbi:zinc knuckle protein, putative (macronuclear) [Tetrahymena thermophila SB210]|uniref:Zinc knuckle protein, putative n=1 Tax=Tetrahymena thermophila (strain SB210) TaxID=312017 RepID=Q22BI1_TETTS|nr:zinc knuckle protein, putative [Tetrahymena thermophila SB210]EAR82623.1 zinc knuckle protein, putative [Tetrahymena thermophila SB210]|eukprot:XP_001030286.1 zinc knuckle protein, putative [Tetrahymena thermophila SB210]